MFKRLYSTDSIQDIGTLKSLQDRISRSNVGSSVAEYYDEDRSFITSVVDMYIVELFMEHFGMADVLDNPTINKPPPFDSLDAKRSWYYQQLSDVINTSIFSKTTSDILNEEALIGMYKKNVMFKKFSK